MRDIVPWYFDVRAKSTALLIRNHNSRSNKRPLRSLSKVAFKMSNNERSNERMQTISIAVNFVIDTSVIVGFQLKTRRQRQTLHLRALGWLGQTKATYSLYTEHP